MVAPPMTQSLMVSATGVHQRAVFKLLPSAFHRACIHFVVGCLLSWVLLHTHLQVLACAADTTAGSPCVHLLSARCQTAGASDNHKIMYASIEMGNATEIIC